MGLVVPTSPRTPRALAAALYAGGWVTSTFKAMGKTQQMRLHQAGGPMGW